MCKFTFLKTILLRLVATLLSLFTVAGFAEESRPPYKIAIFRSDMPFAIELQKGLKEHLTKLGYVEGQDLTYLPTVVKSRIEDYAETKKLVEQKLQTDHPDLFATIGVPASIPAWKALESTGVPMVFSGVSFPVDVGLIPAYGQPTGKNITGVGYYPSPSRILELIRQLFPDTGRFHKIAFAYSGQFFQDGIYVKYLPISVANWQVIVIDYFDYAQNKLNLRSLIDQLQQSNPDLLFDVYGLDMLSNHGWIFNMLEKERKPLITWTSEGVDAGAIAGVLADHQKLSEQQAQIIDRIIKGEKPGDIPPLETTDYRIELNLKKARELGIQFNQEVIEKASRVVR